MAPSASVILALFAMLLWGVWAYCAKIATRTLSPAATMLLTYSMGAAITFAYVVAGPSSMALRGSGVPFAVLGGVFLGAATVSYYGGLRYGRASIVTSVSSLYFVLATALGIVLFGEPTTPSKIGGTASAVVAVVLMVHDPDSGGLRAVAAYVLGRLRHLPGGPTTEPRTLADGFGPTVDEDGTLTDEQAAACFALLALVAWGFWAVTIRGATVTVSPAMTAATTYAITAAIALAYVLATRSNVSLPTEGSLYALAGGLFLGVGAIALYVGLKYGTTGTVTTIVALYFVVTSVLSVALLEERLRKHEVAGIGAAVVAIVLLA